MKYALVNPRWSFHGSTYFGCQDPHLPLELLSAQDALRKQGHDALLIDAQMEQIDPGEVVQRLNRFQEDFLVIPSAPSYLFWRCPPPELRVPQEWIAALHRGSTKVLIGPHASATPKAALRKTGADIAMRGEPDQTLGQLAKQPWEMIAGCCWREGDLVRITESLGTADMKTIGPLDFADYPVERHTHRHHVFTATTGLGAELEFARGCPWSCTFCNKTLFRNNFRERDVDTVLSEIDALLARGVEYIYFIDEIFGVGKNVQRLLEGIARRPMTIGFQSRIDLWDEEGLDLLGRAHCISFECGIESITETGREELNKNCRLSTERITELLIYGRKRIPWVQANLIETLHDNPEEVMAWQFRLKNAGVWVSQPVPMFPFPGSPLYVQTFGAAPDDAAWERAHRHYLGLFSNHGYSDIQEQHPVPLREPGMRLLMTTDTVGGVWSYTRELVTGLLDAGTSLLLVTLGRALTADQLAWTEHTALQYPATFSLEETRYALEWMESAGNEVEASGKHIASLIESYGPELLHTNQFHFASLDVRIPKVLVAHSDVLSWWQAVHGQSPPDTAWIRSYVSLVCNGIRGASMVVAPTQWMLEQIFRYYGQPISSRIIANGMSPASFHSGAPKQLRAVTIGRLWDEGKNIALLRDLHASLPIEVAGEIRAPHKSSANEFHAETLATVGSDPGARYGFCCLGALGRKEIRKLLEESAIYIATSRYEPFGLAPLEAALAGCAIVANDIPSFREIWEGDAIYYEHDDADSLRAVLARLSANPELLRNTSERARRRALGCFRASTMTAAYIQLYQALQESKSLAHA